MTFAVILISQVLKKILVWLHHSLSARAPNATLFKIKIFKLILNLILVNKWLYDRKKVTNIEKSNIRFFKPSKHTDLTSITQRTASTLLEAPSIIDQSIYGICAFHSQLTTYRKFIPSICEPESGQIWCRLVHVNKWLLLLHNRFSTGLGAGLTPFPSIQSNYKQWKVTNKL